MKQYTIAIADDDEDECEILAAAFRERHENAAVLVFGSGSNLLDFMQTTQNLPDLVITDLYMPAPDGFEVIQSIRQNGRLANIPAVLVSTIKNESVLAQLNTINSVHYFLKPNSLDGYLGLADRIMELVGVI